MDGHDIFMEEILDKIPEENREQFLEDLFSTNATRKQVYGIPDRLMNGFYACAFIFNLMVNGMNKVIAPFISFGISVALVLQYLQLSGIAQRENTSI